MLLESIIIMVHIITNTTRFHPSVNPSGYSARYLLDMRDQASFLRKLFPADGAHVNGFALDPAVYDPVRRLNFIPYLNCSPCDSFVCVFSAPEFGARCKTCKQLVDWPKILAIYWSYVLITIN